MNFIKYTQYVYLVFGIYFIYDGVMKLNTDENPWMSFLIAALAIFMFFFRRRFAKKFENNRNDKP